MQAWAATDAGAIREQNQDACLCRPDIGLFAVADGVGGQGDGGIAARKVMAVLAALPRSLPAPARLAAIRTCLQEAHAALLELGAAGTPAMTLATTVVVVMLHGDHFACLWVGDSRAYLMRNGEFCALTCDHSMVQDLISAGVITEAQAERDPRRHIITRAIGAGEEELVVDKVIGRLLPGDRLLLCSDGLYKTANNDEIASVLSGSDDIARRLVEVALARGAPDNVTAVAVLT